MNILKIPIKMKKYIVLFFLIISCLGVGAQEILTGFQYNPVVHQSVKNQQLPKLLSERSSSKVVWIPVTLPFFDDFSDYTGLPDTSLWLDNESYINTDFPYFSANIGAATLDVIDSKGYIYPNASIFPFIADHLTSKPIRLDSIFEPFPREINTGDSVYFSFFYQPQGRAYEPPEATDSLVLEFGHYGEDSVFSHIDSVYVPLSLYIGPGDTVFPGDTLFSPCDPKWGAAVYDTLFFDDFVTLPCDSVYHPEIVWEWIWSSPGMHIDSFFKYYGTYSKQVMIPITDSARFLRNDFFFRFYNYASIAPYPSEKSNCDEWNIDYVYLNIGRSKADTLYRKIGFVERAPSMLKNFETMPYDQYLANPTNVLKQEFELYITNLSGTTFNTIYKYTLENESGTFEKTYDGGSCNLQPFYSNGFQNCETCWQHACPPWKFLFPLEYASEYAIFEIDHILLGDFTTTDTIHDTLRYEQKFLNYFAYDDGTPEDGYGLEPAGAKAAVQFKLNRPDTLYGIQMFFNRTLTGGNDMYFDLVVWRDNNGIPGEEIYRQYYQKPKFSKSIFEIQTYEFDSLVPVNNIFYIGWVQSESKILNVGFDRFNDAREFTFFNVLGNWNSSQYKGALIMRPVLGEEIITSTHENNMVREPGILVYPNPLVQSTLQINITGFNPDPGSTVMVYNSQGILIMEIPYCERIQLNHTIPNGLYFIVVTNNYYQSRVSTRFIISR